MSYKSESIAVVAAQFEWRTKLDSLIPVLLSETFD
jgi:hypothetical protein